ncbi:MAG: phosphopantetheine-binding protein [Proteobacteria bacterium]|nr:phosphopantetheine-binding protein [Pseudomonadota bacterium]
MEALIAELKKKLVETINLPEVNPDSIDINAPLVGGELGIDSIDILELVVMIEQDYGVKIDSKEVGKQVFANLKSLAEYIAAHRTQ